MAALSANRNTSHGHVFGRAFSAVIKTATQIWDGALVGFDANGDLLNMDHAVAGLKFAGYAIRGGLGAASGVNAVYERRGTRWLPHSGTAAASMKGKLAYAVNSSDATDDPATTTNDYIIGRILEVNTTSNEILVDLEDRVAP